MANITLSGILLKPDGTPDAGATVIFTHYSNTGQTVKTSVVEILIPIDGSYTIDLEYGNVRIDYKPEALNRRQIAIVTVNQDTTATSLPELLNAAVPPTDEQLLEFQNLLAEAKTASLLTIKQNAGAAVNIDDTDHGSLIILTNTGNVTVTVNESLTTVGALVFLRYDGTGTCTLAGGAGVTVLSSRGLTFAAQHSTVALISDSQTQWTATGDLGA